MARKIESSLGGVPLENQEAAGIPDSPIFTQSRVEIANPLLGLHVGGTLVADLPLELQGRLLYQQTDEGIAEANEGKSPHRIETVRDELTGKCLERRDAIIDGGLEPWEAPNPAADLAKAYVRPGFKGKFLSPNKIAKEGTRGYQVVKDERGDPVKLRDMPLGEMPIERVQKRNKFYAEKSEQAAGKIKSEYLQTGGGTAVAPTD